MRTLRGTAQPNGTPTWVALNAPDSDKAENFYAALFDWEFVPAPDGEQLIAMKNGNAVAGLLPASVPGAGAPAWITYLATDDIELSLSLVDDEGGHVLDATEDTLAYSAIAEDPAGAVFGLWQAGSLPGIGVWGGPGALMWNEQFSPDSRASKAFYRSLFDNIRCAPPVPWHFVDPSKPVADYTMYSTNGQDIGEYGKHAVASFAELNEHNPVQVPHWMPCFMATTSIHDSVDQVVAIGGKVLLPPYATMFGLLAIVTDDQGAAFMLAGPPKA